MFPKGEFVITNIVRAVAVATTMPAAPTAAPDARDQTLKDLAKRNNLHVGTAVHMDAFGADAVYRERIATESSVVTAENAMKWSVIEPQRGVFNWEPADERVAHGLDENFNAKPVYNFVRADLNLGRR